MPYYEFVWTDEIVHHLAEHGVTPDEVYEMLDDDTVIPVTAYEVTRPRR